MIFTYRAETSPNWTGEWFPSFKLVADREGSDVAWASWKGYPSGASANDVNGVNSFQDWPSKLYSIFTYFIPLVDLSLPLRSLWFIFQIHISSKLYISPKSTCTHAFSPGLLLVCHIVFASSLLSWVADNDLWLSLTSDIPDPLIRLLIFCCWYTLPTFTALGLMIGSYKTYFSTKPFFAVNSWLYAESISSWVVSELFNICWAASKASVNRLQLDSVYIDESSIPISSTNFLRFDLSKVVSEYVTPNVGLFRLNRP